VRTGVNLTKKLKTFNFLRWLCLNKAGKRRLLFPAMLGPNPENFISGLSKRLSTSILNSIPQLPGANAFIRWA